MIMSKQEQAKNFSYLDNKVRNIEKVNYFSILFVCLNPKINNGLEELIGDREAEELEIDFENILNNTENNMIFQQYDTEIKKKIQRSPEIITQNSFFEPLKLSDGKETNKNGKMETKLREQSHSEIDQNSKASIQEPNLKQLSSNREYFEKLQQQFESVIKLPKKIKTNQVPVSNSHEVWRRGPLCILTKIKSAVSTFKNLSEQIRFRRMNEIDFLMINDLSSDYHTLYIQDTFNKQSNFMQQGFNQLHHAYNQVLANKNCYIVIVQFLTNIEICPDSIKMNTWKMVLTFFLIFHFYYQTFTIVFEEDFLQDVSWEFDMGFTIFSILFFIFDIVFNFFISFYNKGILIHNQLEIAKHYITSYLLYDLLILFTGISSIQKNQEIQINNLELIFLELSLSNQLNKWFQLFSIFQIFQINRLMRNIKENLRLSNELDALFTLLQLLIKIVFTAHLSATSFVYITRFEKNEVTWMHKYDIINSNWETQYCTSLYWAVITMITLGYGDIVPNTLTERVFVIFVSIFACGMFAYTFNAIGTIFSSLNEKENRLKKKMLEINFLMQQRGLSHSIQMKMIRYFEYIFNKELENEQSCQNSINKLPTNLKNEMAIEIYGQVLEKTKAFKLNFDEKIRNKIALCFKEMKIPSQTIIIERGRPNSRFYYILDGDVEMFYPIKDSSKKIIFRELQQGDSFGKLSFLTGFNEYKSIITKSIVRIAYIDYQDFIAVLKKEPQDFQNFIEKRDKFLFQRYYGFDMICQICQGFRHIPEKCPKLVYRPRRDKIIQQSMLNEEVQERKSFVRMGKKHLKFQSYIQELHLDALQFVKQSGYFKDNSALADQIFLIEESLKQFKDMDTVDQYNFGQNKIQVKKIKDSGGTADQIPTQDNPSALSSRAITLAPEQKEIMQESKELEETIKNNETQLGNIQYYSSKPSLNLDDQAFIEVNNQPDSLPGIKENLAQADLNEKPKSLNRFDSGFSSDDNQNRTSNKRRSIIEKPESQRKQKTQEAENEDEFLQNSSLGREFQIQPSQDDTQKKHQFIYYQPHYNFQVKEDIFKQNRGSQLKVEQPKYPQQSLRNDRSKQDIVKIVQNLNYQNQNNQ